jgi:hypothetical protein
MEGIMPREVADPNRLERGDLLANELGDLFPVLNRTPKGFQTWDGRRLRNIPMSYVRDATYYYAGKVDETYLQEIESRSQGK